MPPVSVIRISMARAAESGRGNPLVDFVVTVRGRFDKEGALVRQPLRVESADGSRAWPFTATGIVFGNDPAILYGRIELPPGTYHTVVPPPHPFKETFSLTRKAGAPIRRFCRHAGPDPSHREPAFLISGDGTVLAGVTRFHIAPCCLPDFQKNITADTNLHFLQILEPIGRPMEFRLQSGSGAARAAPGDYFIVNPSDMVTALTTRGRGLGRVIDISQQMLRRFRDAARIRKECGPFDFDASPRRMTPRLRSLLARLEEVLWDGDSAGREFKGTSACHEILLTLLDSHPNRLAGRWKIQEASRPVRQEDPRLRDAVRYLHLHYAEPLRIQEVARHASVSLTLLANLFRNHLHQTPMDYLQKLRMEKAKELLRRGGMSLQEIAHSVGYGSARSFRRVFKAHVRERIGLYRAGARGI